MEHIIDILQSYTFTVNDEKYLQSEISEVFRMEGIIFEKEVMLSTGIIDFVVDGIGIEIKIKQQPMSIYRQLERYLEDDRVKEILLASVKTVTLPETINGKRARSVTLRGGI